MNTFPKNIKIVLYRENEYLMEKLINSLVNKDCFEILPEIKDKSVDLILCDLPYGVTARNKWDSILPINKLWEQYERIIKDNGAIVLTAIQPFTSLLVSSNPSLFKYEWIWSKTRGQGFLNCKRQPMRSHESILVFYKEQSKYYPQMRSGKPYKMKQGHIGTNYNTARIENIVTENQGERYPITVLDFSYDKEKLHPTQKPIALGEYMVRTYTDENDLVLDNCCGVGTFPLAAKNLNRRFIGIEKDENYFKIAKERLGL